MAGPDTTFTFRVEARPGYILVWQGGTATEIDQVTKLQAALVQAMAQAGTRLVMFDNRETGRPDEYVRASMWAFISEHIDRTALLQAEVSNVVRAERRGALNRLALRAFQNEAEAERWLLKPPADGP